MVPPFPLFIFYVLLFIVEYLHIYRLAVLRNVPLPPFPLGAILAFIRSFLYVLQASSPVHVIIRNHFLVNRGLININNSVWNQIAVDPEYFWLLTGETPRSLLRIVDRIGNCIESRVRNPWRPRARIQRTRPNALCIEDRVLMTFIWLRQYQTLMNLGLRFGVTASYVCENLFIIIPIVYEHYVHRYISWNNDNEWDAQRNIFAQLPNCVGAIDAFAIQINRPQGAAQRLYYRRDRGFHFLNFHAIIDNDGYFQFVEGGFLGHSTDAGSYHRLPNIGFRQQLQLPRHAYLLADGGYPSVYPLVTPFRRHRPLNWVQRQANFEISRARVRVEHRIGDLRVYRSIPGRSGRFRNRRYFLPLVARVVAALVNRRRRLIGRIRERF